VQQNELGFSPWGNDGEELAQYQGSLLDRIVLPALTRLAMFIAKVIGNVVATQKNAKFRGMKLLLIQPYISKEGKLQISGSSVVAVDSVGAGVGECVLFTQGSSARLTPTTKDAPVDAVIVGIVDAVEVEGAVLEKP
jgi:ethanolamine utilization protein EutN